MFIPIRKETIEKMYYRWWLDICKSVNPAQRSRVRCALSVIEAYRADFIYEVITRLYKSNHTNKDFSLITWKAKTMRVITQTLENDKVRISLLAERCSNLLIGIAGVINGGRRVHNPSKVFNTILLLDVVDSGTVEMLNGIELENVKFIKESKSIYLPIHEPELYSVVREVEKLLANNAALNDRIALEYTRREGLLSTVLGVHVELANDVV